MDAIKAKLIVDETSIKVDEARDVMLAANKEAFDNLTTETLDKAQTAFEDWKEANRVWEAAHKAYCEAVGIAYPADLSPDWSTDKER